MISETLFVSLAAFAVCLQVTAASGGKVTDDAVVIGDIEVDPRKSTVAGLAVKWPGGSVPYVFNSNLDRRVHSEILAAMKTIENSVNSAQSPCVHFVKRTNEYNYIEIFQGTGCHSAVGMENRGRQEVSIGKGCEFKGIIMHELLHALGFYHEHNRYDRDDNVYIDLGNVKAANHPNFELKKPNELDLQNTPYNFESIMGYDPYTLALDPSVPVMIPLPGKADNVFQMGQRMWLADMDVLRIQRLYGCQEDTTHIVRPEKDRTVLACNFQFGLCGMTDGGAGLQWITQSGASSAGPAAGHSIGTDSYLVATASGNRGKTAKISSPVSSAGASCVDFYLFLKDSTSSFVVEASGPDFMTTPLPMTVSADNRWTRYQTTINLPPGIRFQISFKAVVGSSDVAVDDLRIYTGPCN